MHKSQMSCRRDGAKMLKVLHDVTTRYQEKSTKKKKQKHSDEDADANKNLFPGKHYIERCRSMLWAVDTPQGHTLLTRLDVREQAEEICIPNDEEPRGAPLPVTAVLYLHGFPDMSVTPITGEWASRLPRKLSESLSQRFNNISNQFAPLLGTDVSKENKVRQKADCAKRINQRTFIFASFNSSGIPGSDETLPFFNKTVSQDCQDAVAVCRFVRSFLDFDLTEDSTIARRNSSYFFSSEAKKIVLHLIGVSTGAIIAALLRHPKLNDVTSGIGPRTVTTIAGLVDPHRGCMYDFSADQVRQYLDSASDEEGKHCRKEFWLPETKEAMDEGNMKKNEQEGSTQFTKQHLRLGIQYINEFFDTRHDRFAFLFANNELLSAFLLNASACSAQELLRNVLAHYCVSPDVDDQISLLLMTKLWETKKQEMLSNSASYEDGSPFLDIVSAVEPVSPQCSSSSTGVKLLLSRASFEQRHHLCDFNPAALNTLSLNISSLDNYCDRKLVANPEQSKSNEAVHEMISLDCCSPPILIIHGADDQNVPCVPNAFELFAVASAAVSFDKNDTRTARAKEDDIKVETRSNEKINYARLLVIPGANHLLTNTSHFKKAVSELATFIEECVCA